MSYWSVHETCWLFFLTSNRNKPLKCCQRPSNVIFVFSEIVLQHNSQTLTACNSETSAVVITWVLRAPLRVPTAHDQWTSASPTCILLPWFAGGDSPGRSVRACCACSFFRSKTASPLLGPCLEMSHVLQACLVLIISSCVCDWCLPA